MNLRAKLFPALLIACVALMALLCAVQYARARRAVEAALRADVRGRATRFARAVAVERDARLVELHELAGAPQLNEFWSHGAGLPSARLPAPASVAPPASLAGAESPVARDVLDLFRAFFARAGKVYAALTLVTNAHARQVVRFEPRAAGETPDVKTDEFALGSKGFDGLLARAVEEHTSFGDVKRTTTAQGAIIYVVPVWSQREGQVGSLVAELKPDVLVSRAAEGLADAPDSPPGKATASRPAFQLLALDRAGRFVYHTNEAMKFQTVAAVMPHFNAVAGEMNAGRGGAQLFDGADGASWLAAYEPVAGFDLSVAVAANASLAEAEVRRTGWLYVVLSVGLACAVAALVVVREVRAARRIERVARAARAVAGGDLDGRLDVSVHDRTRPIAESFNLMTDRLREHLRRETENRQFQAFTRLSAMLTHDLKNAITGLSMLVANMERQWEREEFRADAVTSLREATDKLRALVARLSKPVETLSGEYRRTHAPVDLVPIIRRVLDATAARSSFHEVEIDLPDSLEVAVDAERVASVVENLVVNALEAMGAKPGRLTVAAGREGADYIFITVADTGAGMSAEFVRAKLFQPFSTTKKQGLGLGLYTCREVIEAHGGRINVESVQGSGTRFRVVLPSRPVSLPRSQS
jgi:signal transduction histidine kinase